MTPSYETTSNIATYQRGGSFGMPAERVDGNDVEAVYESVEKAVSRARSGDGPTFIEAMTYRLWGHMMGDPEVYRTKDEVTKAHQTEPVARLRKKLLSLGNNEQDLAKIEQEADSVIQDALAFADSSPEPLPEAALEDIFSG